jgi:predicted nucleic acid-binding protein
VTSKSLRSVAADSNVLLSAAVGRAARRIFEKMPRLSVVTTESTLAEVRKYLPVMASRYGLDLEQVEEALKLLSIQVFSERHYRTHLPEARKYIEKRDPDDVALAALALKLKIPIWSNDRDFEGLPLDVYPTARLLKLLEL